VVGILWEVTASRQFQGKLDSIDAAGAELLRIDAASLANLNMAERLRLLEEKIVKALRDLLHFDHFEVRLIDRETNQLQLVISMGLAPLRIGEMIYAEPEHNGISGYVAATGRSYVCPDIPNDPRYREGLEEAASSLTVPLRLHDKVIGVLNVESVETNSFSEQDRRFAEIFGRYIALSMHILDLLVVERYTTNEQLAANVVRELNDPLNEIAGAAAKLRAGDVDPETQSELNRIIEAVGTTRRRLEACTAGPRSILGAEEELHRAEIDPKIKGRRVLVADNEPNIRDSIAELLRQRGADVTVCNGGTTTIETLQQSYGAGERYDLVISDIRMPDRNGYEVFRAAHELDPDIPVILMTGFGYDPHHSIVRASQEGLQSFLFKPLRASHLLEEVVKAFEASDESA
jgi:CheY-like chemotaxis protein